MVKNYLFFFAQRICQYLLSTQIMWLGLHCKIDEVRVNLSFFSNRGKIDVDFQKKLVRSEIFVFEAVRSFYFFLGINVMKKNYDILIQSIFQVTGVFSKLT